MRGRNGYRESLFERKFLDENRSEIRQVLWKTINNATMFLNYEVNTLVPVACIQIDSVPTAPIR